MWGLQQSRLEELVALWHVGSSLTRDPTCVPFTAMWILNDWTAKEVLYNVFLNEKKKKIAKCRRISLNFHIRNRSMRIFTHICIKI